MARWPSLWICTASLIHLVGRSCSLSMIVVFFQSIVWLAWFAWSVSADFLYSVRLAVRWLLIVASRLGRTEYQLLLMKISWLERNVKIRYKCLVVIYKFVVILRVRFSHQEIPKFKLDLQPLFSFMRSRCRGYDDETFGGRAAPADPNAGGAQSAT